MSDTDLSLEDFRAKYLREYELQKRSDITPPVTLLYWVGYLQEYYCHAAFGGAGYLPKLDPNVCDSTLIEIDAEPHLRISAKWGSPQYVKQRMALDDFLTCIPNMSGKMTVREDHAQVELTFPLDRWPSLLTGVLWERLYYGLVHNDTPDDVRAFCLAKATELLDRFYPHVNIAGLHIAAELGMIDYAHEVFPAWFKEHCEHKKVIAAELPDNLDGPVS